MKIKLTKGRITTKCQAPGPTVENRSFHLSILMSMIRLGWTISGELQ